MRRDFFVTGTDTGVGKTLASAALLRALRRQRLAVAGMKPVASGCEATPGGLRNDDALLRITSYNVCYTKLLRRACTSRGRSPGRARSA